MSPELLFPAPGREFLALLAGLPAHLDAAMPLRRQHKRELPGDIRELSHLLTDERGDLRRDYLADPAALSAYLRYFLPWNIFRLGTLFRGLALDPGGEAADGAATIVDLGAGPLTAPLALWMARPHLRKRPLTFVCVDRAPKPMRLGLTVLESLARKVDPERGLAPWKITLVKGPLDARLREKADLLLMANALNEVLHRGEGDLLENADALAWHLSTMLAPAGQMLLVEPGVRPSAHLIAALRLGLLRHGLHPLAPCPHTGPCPMSGRGYTAWCHFNFDAEPAPRWLKELSESARLPKDNVSLSLLHFSARGGGPATEAGKSPVRAVSGPFELPGGEERRYGQYACSERGLTILTMPRKFLLPLPGTLLHAAWPEAPEQDVKSGAFILPLGAEHAPPKPAPKLSTEPKPGARPASGPTASRPDKAKRPDRADRIDQTDRSERPDRTERSGRSERTAPADKPAKGARPHKSDRSTETNAAGKPARPARPDRPDRSDRPAKVAKAGKPASSATSRPKPARPTDAPPRPPKARGQALTVDDLLADEDFQADDSLLREAGEPAAKPAKGKKPGGAKHKTSSGGAPGKKRKDG